MNEPTLLESRTRLVKNSSTVRLPACGRTQGDFGLHMHDPAIKMTLLSTESKSCCSSVEDVRVLFMGKCNPVRPKGTYGAMEAR